MDEQYEVRYLRLFEKDLEEIVTYISDNLQNIVAAENFVHDVEVAIKNRSYMPLAFEPFRSHKARTNTYYVIRVRNFNIYYIVKGSVMEVHRIIYNRRQVDLWL